MASRVIMRIELRQEAKDKLQDFTDRLGLTQVAAVSKLIEWFTSQSETVQGAVLGLYPESIVPDVITVILKQMAGQKVTPGGRSKRS